MMNALTTEKSNLEHKEDLCGIWMYGGMLAVFAGVVIETLPDFLGTSGILGLAHRIGGGLVAGGLAVEFVVQLFASKYAGKLRAINASIISDTLERVANANQTAAEATERAEQERSARLAMLGQLKPRGFTPADMNAFVASIEGKLTALDLFILTDDFEARVYGFSVMDALSRASVSVREHWLPRFPIPDANTGLHLYEKPIGSTFDVLCEAFGKLGHGLASLNPEREHEGVANPSLFVGTLPPPFMNAAERLYDPSERPKAPWE